MADAKRESKAKFKAGLKLDVSTAKQGEHGVAISDTGSLRDGDLSLNMQGLRIRAEGAANASAAQTDTEYSGMTRDHMDVIRPLGEGSSGVVQLVRHKPTGQLMALKMISLGISERERKQILQELRVLHRALVLEGTEAEGAAAEGAQGAAGGERRVPAIISFLGAFYADGAIHIALEYMNRGSLHEVLRKSGPIEARVLAAIATQLLRGLKALQALKIVHRDVKPGNVLLSSAGDVKLADLGMCGELASTFSRLRSWVGTAAYMSPERINGSDYSFNSDVWSLGVTLWECAAGRYPFASSKGGEAGGGLLPEEAGQGMIFWELLHNIVEGDAPELPPPADEKLVRFVKECMTRDPSQRPGASALLAHPWIQATMAEPPDLKKWIGEVAPNDSNEAVA